MTDEGRCPFEEIVARITAIGERTFQRPLPDGSHLRQFHRKTHACVRAELAVEPPGDPALRHGLFAEPARYSALVRFSSSFFENDRLPDGRGMAIKLSGVPGAVCEGAPPGQHDLVLLNAPLAPHRDAAEALALFEVLDGVERVTMGTLMAPRYVVTGRDPRRFRWHYLRSATDTARRSLVERDLTRHAYFSVTPYRLGDGAMKVELRPDAAAGRRRRARGGDFRTRLQRALAAGPVGFDVLVQPRDPGTDSLDDASTAWNGPTVRVGHLSLASRLADGDVALGDRLAFSPWNCLRAHEPLGSINRVRREAYALSAARREGDAVLPPGS